MANGIFRRNSSNNGWIDFNSNNQIKIRNSANNGWITPSSRTISRRNSANDGWIQIYPLGVVTTSATLNVSSSGLNTKQYNYTSWKIGISRQGWNVISSGGGQQFGVINSSCSALSGNGSITNRGTWTFSGTLGGAGNYNANQTITFRGSSYNGGTGSSETPFNTHDSSGMMTFSWKASGANSTIPSGTVTHASGNAALNWMNNVSNYGRRMCMYNGETSSNTGNSNSSSFSNNYLEINSYNMVISNYQYQATTYSLDRPESAAIMFSMSSRTVPKNENYLNIALPANYVLESTEELISKIENEEIEYITPDQVAQLQDIDYKPVIFSINDDKVYTSPIFEETHIVQYFFENKWINAINIEPRIYVFREGATKVRLYDSITEEVFYEISI